MSLPMPDVQACDRAQGLRAILAISPGLTQTDLTGRV
jgi:hypothetical protein